MLLLSPHSMSERHLTLLRYRLNFSPICCIRYAPQHSCLKDPTFVTEIVYASVTSDPPFESDRLSGVPYPIKYPIGYDRDISLLKVDRQLHGNISATWDVGANFGTTLAGWIGQSYAQERGWRFTCCSSVSLKFCTLTVHCCVL